MNNIKRISFQEGVDLYNNADILELGRMADNIRREKHPENIVTFVIDRNIIQISEHVNVNFVPFIKMKMKKADMSYQKKSLHRKFRKLLI